MKRTKFLTVLCALSGVSAIYGILTGLGAALSPVDIDSALLESRMAMIDDMITSFGRYGETLADLRIDMEDYDKNLMLNLGNLGAATFLFSGIQAIGVYMMYHHNRIGFSLYSLSQIGAAASPVIFGGFNTFGQISLAIFLSWNFVWVLMFATQLKRFHN